MHRRQAILTAFAAAMMSAADFSGASALEFTRKAVAYGPRPVNSANLARLRAYLTAQLKLSGCELIQDRFKSPTPIGDLPMENIICKLAGSSGRAVVLTGHYDTKMIPNTGGGDFLGANDGGSSTGFLLEMARVAAAQQRKDDIYLVFFDGEEAIGPWSETDGVHGSRHLADRWEREGFLRKIRALINVDMIGDRDLRILPEGNSTPSLRQLIWRAAADLGLSRHFIPERQLAFIEDDHAPFLRKGVPACDLIDFDYGPANSFWHSPGDTLDKLDAGSLDVVGRVMMEVLKRLGALP